MNRKIEAGLGGFAGLFTLLRAAYRNAKWVTIGALALYPVARLESVVVALGLRRTIDAAMARSAQGALVGVSMIVAGVSLLYIVDQIAWRLCLRLEESVGHALERRTAELVAITPGLEHFERPEYLDRIEILREQGWMLGRHLYSIPMSLGDLTRSVATIALLGTVHPLLYLLPLFGLPALFTDSISDTISRRAEEASATPLRRSRHLYELSVRPDAAKEIRIFGLRKWLFDSHREVWREVHRSLARARIKSTLLSSAGWLAFAAAFVVAVVFVLRLALTGEASLGELVLTLTLGVRVGGEVSAMASEVTYVRRIGRLGSHLSWLEAHAVKAGAAFAGTRRFTGFSEGITFNRVSFSYPGSEGSALREVSLHLNPGSTVALVGQNGAGKTTLLKLLCRMYEPTSGSILVDGVPLCDYDPYSWLSSVTAAFQDFAKLEVTVRETVGLGDVAHLGEAGRIDAALDRADARSMVEAMPEGIETLLGGSWEGGHEPSIGQWQKLAIARCAMPASPALFILDEPTSSLDPQTEHLVFERHRRIASMGSPGAITLLVSHRFSTVSTADTIIVLERGVVIESGSHEELMAADGYYARFYRIQRDAYR